MIISEEVYLAHHGIKGMKWGVRKSRDSTTSESTSQPKPPRSKKRAAAIVLGSAAAATAIAAGVIFAAKHKKAKMATVIASEAGKKFAKSIAQEPVGIVHTGRGHHFGFTFIQRGGLADPLHEYESSGMHKLVNTDSMHRYGARSEKIAASFRDPEGRFDFSGRPIYHEVMLPEEMSKGIIDHKGLVKTVWPLIKDTYSAVYDKTPEGPGGI